MSLCQLILLFSLIMSVTRSNSAEPHSPKPTEWVPPTPKPTEWVPPTPKPTEWIPPTPKPTEWVPPTPKPTEWVPPTPKPTEWVPPTPKPTEWVPPTPKPTEWIPPTPKPTEWVPPTPKPTEWVPPTPKPTEWIPPTPKPTEWIPPTPKPTEWVPPTPKPTEWVPPTPKPTEWIPPTPKPTECISTHDCDDWVRDHSCQILELQVDSYNKSANLSGIYFQVKKCINGHPYYHVYSMLDNHYYWVYYNEYYYVIGKELGNHDRYYGYCQSGDLEQCLFPSDWSFYGNDHNGNDNSHLDDFKLSLKQCPPKPTPKPTRQPTLKPTRQPTLKPTRIPLCPYPKCGNKENICEVAVLLADECKSIALSGQYYWRPDQCWNNAPYYVAYSLQDRLNYFIYLHRKPDEETGIDHYYYAIGKDLGGKKYFSYCKEQDLELCGSDWYFDLEEEEGNNKKDSEKSHDKFKKLNKTSLVLSNCDKRQNGIASPPPTHTKPKPTVKPTEWRKVVETTSKQVRECESSMQDNICLFNDNINDENDIFGTYNYAGCYQDKPYYKLISEKDKTEYFMFYEQTYGIAKSSLGNSFDYGFCDNTDLKSCCGNGVWSFSSKSGKWETVNGISLKDGSCE